MDEKTLSEIEAKATEALEARRAYEPAPRADGAWDRVTMSETDLADAMTPERVLALVAEVRRLRAVEAAAKAMPDRCTWCRSPFDHEALRAALKNT